MSTWPRRTRENSSHLGFSMFDFRDHGLVFMLQEKDTPTSGVEEELCVLLAVRFGIDRM